MGRDRGKVRGALALLLAVVSPAALPAGQVTTDGRFGPAQTLTGPHFGIAQSLGAVRGGNLFHSFGLFSLAAGDTADFTSSGMTNIIARVTGGSVSSIDGTLQAQQPGVNLYFINPSGIRFGPDARLNVAGSFYASTANYLRLADGGRFDASSPGNSVLTAASPAAFGFLGGNPARITVTGSRLLVPNDHVLGLIGGEVIVTGSALVGTKSGRGIVNLAAVGAAGEAKLGAGALDIGSFAKLGRISISDHAEVDVSECCGSTSGAGTIYIRGGELTVSASTLTAATVNGNSGGVDIDVSGGLSFRNQSLISARTGGSGNAGTIVIRAGRVAIAGNSFVNSASLAPEGGRGGNITIHAAGTIFFNGDRAPPGPIGCGQTASCIVSQALGDGRGGDLDIRAGGRFTMPAAYILTNGLGNGDAGAISIRAPALALRNGALIDSSGNAGRGGNITLTVTGEVSLENHSLIRSDANGNGDAGRIEINAGSLRLSNLAGIENSGARKGSGRGGDVRITVSRGEVLLDNASIRTEAFGDGDAGNIDISSRSLRLVNGAYITSRGSGPSAVGPTGQGRGGDIAIRTSKLGLDGGYILASAQGPGNGGNIVVNADSVTLERGGHIQIGAQSTATGDGGTLTINTRLLSMSGAGSGFVSGLISESAGAGSAGRITVNADRVTLSDGASISASARGTGQGGDISVTASEKVTIASGGSIQSLSTRAKDGAGAAGNVFIDAGAALLLDNGSIETSTQKAPGGNITIRAAQLIRLRGSSISASALGGVGDGGNIAIDPIVLILDNSTIRANAVAGHGGNIDIVAGLLLSFPDPVSETITATSELGVSGTITVSPPGADLSGGLVTLPSAYLDASVLLAERCAARIAGQAGSFVVAGRGGVPVEPGNWLTGLGAVPWSDAIAQADPAAGHVFPPVPAVAGARACR